MIEMDAPSTHLSAAGWSRRGVLLAGLTLADWAAQNADTDRAKAISGIQFGVELSPHRMRCTPAA